MPQSKRPVINARRLLPSVRHLMRPPPPPVTKKPKRRDDPEDPNAVKENKNIKPYYDMTPEEKKEFNARRGGERPYSEQFPDKGMKKGGAIRGYGMARGGKVCKMVGE